MNNRCWERMFLMGTKGPAGERTKVPRNKKSRERKFPGTKSLGNILGNECSPYDLLFLETKALGHEKSQYTPERRVRMRTLLLKRGPVYRRILYSGYVHQTMAIRQCRIC